MAYKSILKGVNGLVIHTVQPGDSIYTIAQKYQVSSQRLIEDNALQDLPYLVPGQALVVDNSQHQAAPKLGTIEVNGYIFPHIDDETLRRILPHLTYISIFSYQIAADGNLTEIQDQKIIDTARAQRVAPLMVVTNIKSGGGFDSDLAHSVLNNDAAQSRLIENILKILPKGYAGLNIDLEYVYPEDRERYNRFLIKVTQALHPLGYSVSTALAPKTSAEQVGLLYQGHDYPFHGANVDHVILMTYEWGYTRGPAQAVAPLNKVEQVIRYAVSVIPSEKILMGIPNYGYDWTLPYMPGSVARSLSNTEAVALAARVGANIRFDETAQSPFFYYYSPNGRQHVVWFEDARSIAAKLKLVDTYKLGGISYWTLNKFFPQSWVVLESMYNVKKVLDQ